MIGCPTPRSIYAIRRPSTSAKRFSRAQALPAERVDCDGFSGVISVDWEDRCDIGHLREFISEKNRAIPNESADPEQCDRDKRIDLQSAVRQLGRDRTAEVAGRENEFHRGWHDEQRRECNFHHAEQSKITSDSELRHLLGNRRIARELQYAQKRDP